MASYVYVKNPNGTTYVYQNESYWDKAEQKTKHHRKCVGKLHPETNELIPSRKKSITTDPDVKQNIVLSSQLDQRFFLIKLPMKPG